MRVSNRIPRYLAPLALALGSLVAATTGAPLAGAQTTEMASRKTVLADQRFEGYVWLDPDGQSLPIQSDDAIEEFLRSATVESIEKIPTGVTRPKKVLLTLNGVRAHAAFKYVEETKKDVNQVIAGRRYTFREWRDSHIYDVAAYHVDRLLGLDRVPPAAPRKIKRKQGSLKIWIEGSINDKTRRDRGIEPPDLFRWNQQRQIMHVFDNLVANRDSNLGNTLIDGNWRLWFIDCGRCFGTTEALLYPESISYCERGLWRVLQNLDEANLRERLDPYLGRYEIDALLVRRDKVVEHIQALIDELGEERVLFDLRPPGDRAPWAEN